MKPLTTAIIARNAEATIERALRSVMVCGNDWPILLVDDSDGDGTADVARRVAGDQITIVKPAEHIGTGNARQTAIEHIQTLYGMWLDADDELMPNRLPDMLARLEQGDVDLVYDGAILMDEATGKKIKDLPIPDFMLEKDGIYRNLERNWLPALTGSFRNELALRIGYDREFLTCEDYDFLFRSIMQGANVGYLDSLNVEYYHSKNSVSRNMENTSLFNKKCYEKHNIQAIENCLSKSSLLLAEQKWIGASSALYADNLGESVYILEGLLGTSDNIITYGRSANWLAHYLKASICINKGAWQDAYDLLLVIENTRSPDVYNNLAVCMAFMGRIEDAKVYLNKAHDLFNDFYSVKMNIQKLLSGEYGALQAVVHPLRVWGSRDGY